MPEFNLLHHLIAPKPATVLTPQVFFVANSGVLVLAFEGFSNTLLRIKDELAMTIPSLPSENPGSRWAKTTLAALKPGTHLTRADIDTLRDLCDQGNAWLEAVGNDFVIDHLAVVLFVNRSLEQRLLTHRIPLSHPGLRIDPPDAGHRATCSRILAQFNRENLDSYAPRVMQGLIRSSDYRVAHPEATLVYDFPEEQPVYLNQFREAVEEKLPGRYDWFAPRTRHVTIRALSRLD